MLILLVLPGTLKILLDQTNYLASKQKSRPSPAQLHRRFSLLLNRSMPI